MLNRRQALVRTAAAASAAWLSPGDHFAGAQNPPSRMRFGLVTYLWGQHMTLPELLKNCAEAEILGVELRTEHKHGVEPSLSKLERQEVRQRFADSPVALVGYGSNCEYHSEDPQAVKANIEQTKQYIRLMHDCGGSGVKVKPNGFPRGRTRAQTIQQIGQALNEVAAYAQGYGQQIRVEVHGGGTSELPVMRDIFAVADHPNVGVCWNSNDVDLAGDGLVANFRMVQHRFGDTAHVRELNDPTYPYAELMKLFSGIDYAGWILLEARTEPADKLAALIEQRQIFEQWMR